MTNAPTTRSGIGPGSSRPTISSRKRRRIRSSLGVCLLLAVGSAPRAVASPLWLPRQTRLLYRFEYSSSSVTNPGVLLGKPEEAGRSTTIRSSVAASLDIRVGEQVIFLFENPH